MEQSKVQNSRALTISGSALITWLSFALGSLAFLVPILLVIEALTQSQALTQLTNLVNRKFIITKKPKTKAKTRRNETFDDLSKFVFYIFFQSNSSLQTHLFSLVKMGLVQHKAFFQALALIMALPHKSADALQLTEVDDTSFQYTDTGVYLTLNFLIRISTVKFRPQFALSLHIVDFVYILNLISP